MFDAPRIMITPLWANSFGGFAMFALAAASSLGSSCSFAITRRMRTGAGAFSITIRLCTPSASAEA